MPCASGGRGINGERCPYFTHALQTLEGYEAWDVIQRGAMQLKLTPSGSVLGFDWPALLAMADALGYGRQSFLSLISDAESGMLLGIKETHHGDNA